MECKEALEALYEHHRGWCGPGEARAVEDHLAACPHCAAEFRSSGRCLLLLRALPEIEPPPEAWSGIAGRLVARRSAIRRGWIPLAAAAVLAAAVCTAVVAHVTRPKALPVVVESRKALAVNETFHASEFSTLAVPGVGTVRANVGAVLRFLGPRALFLESGEIFAEIARSGVGFEVRTSLASARALGTRFGVRAPSTVYVVEGVVEVRSKGGRVELGPNEVSVGTARAAEHAERYLGWLADRQRPLIHLTLDPGERTVVTPGAPLRWNVIIRTDALAPLYLPDPRDPSQFLALEIDGRSVSLDPARMALRAARASNGMTRLDVSHPCVIECAVDPALFREKGRSTVRAIFTSGQNAPEGCWVGILRSNPIHVEVR